MSVYTKGQQLYEGKAKKVFTTSDPDVCIVSYKDDATAFNGQKKGLIKGKGVINNKTTNFFMRLLEERGVSTHLIAELNDSETAVRRVEIVPLEVIVRNIAAGSLSKRLRLPEGSPLTSPVLEFCYKSDELGDPMVNDSHIMTLSLASRDELDTITRLAFLVNEILRDFLRGKNIELIDMKLEFGRFNGSILLADEISPDTCRFWDSETNEKLDKDRFRRDMGGVEEAYNEIFRRLGLEKTSAYAAAGVDVEAGYEAVRLMGSHVHSTFNENVLTGIGGFGGLYSLSGTDMRDPVLVAGTDGVGTKLKLAFLQDKHDTVGIDCVAMCVNDIICCGARPLFLLDYIACGKNKPEKIAAIVKGVAEGCKAAGMALIGGETAEHPGLMPDDEYDLAGFAVGVVERDKIIDGSRVSEGDAIIGLASSGLHSNGFSLVRRLFSEDELTSHTELLTPTRIYVESVTALRRSADLLALSHITGGGIIENLPRMLPDGMGALLDGAWEIPDIFRDIAARGGISRSDMLGTFNMGIGMAAVVPSAQTGTALAALRDIGQKAWVIGRVVAGSGVTDSVC